MSRRSVSWLCTLLLVLPLTVTVAGELSPEQVREILAERIDKQEKSVGIAVGLIDENGSSVVSYGKLSQADTREPDGKTVFRILYTSNC